MKDNNQLSDEELQEIKNCLANITQGQWHDVLTIRKNKRTVSADISVQVENPLSVNPFILAQNCRNEDAVFIANAPNMVRKLVMEVERLKKLERINHK